MFDDLVISSPTPKKTNKSWAVMFSVVLQCLIITVLVLVPLVYTEVLPRTMLTMLLVAPPPPPPPPPPAPAQVVRVKPMARLMQAGKLMAPKAIPKDIKIFKEAEMPPDVGGAATGGVPGGVPGGTAGGVMGGIISNVPPPPKVTQTRIRQGGQVVAANLINKITPQYPPLARQARIQGTVKLHAIIAKDGSIQELQQVSGHPLLIQAALDAVRQWRYRPTLLNGEPVEVDTTIDVIFSLNQ